MPNAPALPRVFVTEGTTHTDAWLSRLAIRAFADWPGEVLVVGQGLEARRAVPLPPNVRLVPYVRYSAALAGAALLVTNGGAGSLVAALAAGVPALILPAGLDKGDAAERVAWAGAGLRLPPASRCPLGEIRAAATELLRAPYYRESARKVASVGR